MNINDLLPNVPIFCTLDPEELVLLKHVIEKRVLKENEIVFQEGDPGDGVYIVAVGAVKVIKRIDDASSKVLANFTDGEFFGELALLDGQPRSAGAVATRSTVLLRITFENFRRLMNQSPFVALKIISQVACHLSIRLRESNLKLSELENYRLLRG